MEVDHLLDEFTPVTTQAWEDVIHQDLKGAVYAKKMIWHSPERIEVKPYYRREDLADLNLDQLPGSFPYLRSSRATGDWLIREEIDSTDPEQANREAQTALSAGAEEISFRRVAVRNASDLGMLLVNLQANPLHFENGDEDLINLFCDRFKGRMDLPKISMGMNPLANPDLAAAMTRKTPPDSMPFTINCGHLEQEGANAVQEVGLALAGGIDFLAEMQARDIQIDRASASVAFSFSIGASYFFQIAKFRAFRLLWAKAVESFGGSRNAARACIHARTSFWDKTIYDPHINVLRATTEAMSAVLGGVDSVCVVPFDACYKAPDEGSRRLARCTQLILKHEALLTHVADPGAGSYYLESLTESIAREGWAFIQQIEMEGGYQKALAGGTLRKMLEQSRKVREEAVTTRRRIFTGTSQYSNPSERALGRIELPYAEAAERGAANYEHIRLRTERSAAETGKTPRLLIAEFGDAKMRAARSHFAANFFACAGFEIMADRYVDSGAIACVDADLIVLCSADSEYLEMATALESKLKTLGREIPVIVAGNPQSIEQLRAAGVADFIHIRSNPIETLTKWQQRLGMKV